MTRKREIARPGSAGEKILKGIREGLKSSEISERYGVAKSTVHTTTYTWRQRGIIESTGEPGRFRLIGEQSTTNGNGRGRRVVRQAMQQVSIDAKVGKAMLDLGLLSACADHPEKLVAWIDATKEMMR